MNNNINSYQQADESAELLLVDHNKVDKSFVFPGHPASSEQISSKKKALTLIVSGCALVAVLFMALFSFRASSTNQDDVSHMSASLIPMLGKSKKNKKPNKHLCSDIFGQPLSEFGMADSSGVGLLVDDFTWTSVPTDNPNVAKYFLQSSKPVEGEGFGDKKYLEFGTITLLGDADPTYSPTTNCHASFEMHGFFDNEWTVDTQDFVFTTWDDGIHWIMSGTQDFNAEVKTTQALMFSPMNENEHHSCKHRVNKMITAFEEKGIDVADGIADIC